MNRLAPALVTVAVLGAVAIGLYLNGSPAEQRLYRFDEKRVSDLNSLSRAIQRHWGDHGSPPASIDEMIDGANLGYQPRDPATGSGYEYELIGESGFRLCADFQRPTRNPVEGDFWAHGAGHTCFDFRMAPPQ